MKNNVLTKFICVLAAACLSVSCGDKDAVTTGKTPVVKVYDTYLYYEDLGDLIPHGMNKADSAATVRSYVEVWAKQQLMIKKAEINLTGEMSDIQKKVEEYRDNLLIYRYKDEFIARNIDTVVTVAQAKSYYDGHLEDFRLPNTVVKAFTLKVQDNAKDQWDARKLLNYQNAADSAALLAFCKERAVSYDNFSNRWVSLAEACADLPEIVADKNDALKTRGILTFKETDGVYMLKILDCIPTGGQMPFDMARTRISRIVVNARKTKLITDLESSIYSKALSEGSLEYFDLSNPSNIKK